MEWKFNGNYSFFLDEKQISWTSKSGRSTIPLKQVSTVNVRKVTPYRLLGICFAIIALMIIAISVLLGSVVGLIFGIIILLLCVLAIISKKALLEVQSTGGSYKPITFKSKSISVAFEIEEKVIATLRELQG